MFGAWEREQSARSSEQTEKEGVGGPGGGDGLESQLRGQVLAKAMGDHHRGRWATATTLYNCKFLQNCTQISGCFSRKETTAFLRSRNAVTTDSKQTLRLRLLNRFRDYRSGNSVHGRMEFP